MEVVILLWIRTSERVIECSALCNIPLDEQWLSFSRLFLGLRSSFTRLLGCLFLVFGGRDLIITIKEEVIVVEEVSIRQRGQFVIAMVSFNV